MHWTVRPLFHTVALPSMELSAVHRRFLRSNGFGAMQLMRRLSHSEVVLSNFECWKRETGL